MVPSTALPAGLSAQRDSRTTDKAGSNQPAKFVIVRERDQISAGYENHGDGHHGCNKENRAERRDCVDEATQALVERHLSNQRAEQAKAKFYCRLNSANGLEFEGQLTSKSHSQ